MRKIKIKNSNNKEVILTNKAPFILQSFEFKTGVNVYNYKGMNQDGASYEGNTLDVGDATLQFTILAQSKEELQRRKKHINNVFNPKLGEVIVIDNKSGVERKVECIVTELPFFSPQSNVETICLISMIAHDPYYKDLVENKAEIAIWKPSFEFPLDILPEGIDIGYREPSLIVNILNQGDVSCGMRIVFTANATVVNPSLFNINTREYFKINKTLSAGEKVVVTTEFQNKRVKFIKNGIKTTLHDWDYNSTFLQLDQGDNLFRYDATEGIDNLEVDVYYTQKHMGV